jgi:adenylate cyclase
LQRKGSKTPTRDDFVFLGIDQSTLELKPPVPNEFANSRALQLMTEHPFPWSREVWALLLDRLFASGTRLVLFDFVFNPPRDGDPAFRAALDRYRGKVVLAANLDVVVGKGMQAIAPNDVLIPPPQMADPRVGYVNLVVDAGYQPTRSIHVNLPDGYTISRESLPPDPARSIRYTLTDRQFAGQAPHPNEKVFHSLSARGLEQLGRGAELPRDHDAHVLRFSADDAYLPRPLYEVFDDKLWHASYRDGAFFKDKVVMIGAASQIAHDVVDTPLGRSRSGPKLQLEAMAAAMAHQFVWMTPLWVDFLLVFAAGLLAWALIGFVRHPLTAFLLLVGITVVYLAVALIAYDWVGLLLITVPVLTVFLLSGLFSLGYEYRMERIDKLRTRRPLRRYALKNLVK